MSSFTFSALVWLATQANCGGAPPAELSPLANHLAATAQQESGGDTLTIGINADPVRGLPHEARHFTTAQEAVLAATTLLAQGRNIDLGLMGINSRYLGSLTLQTAFVACANMREGAAHYGRDIQAVIFELAHRRYNTGSIDRGAGYAASIERRIASAHEIGLDAAPLAPPAPPPPPLCAPAWDAWALASCQSRRSAPSPHQAGGGASPPASLTSSDKVPYAANQAR